MCGGVSPRTTEDIVLAVACAWPAHASVNGARRSCSCRVTELPPFHNEPVLDLTQAVHRDELREGLAWLDERLPLPAPIWIGQERRDGQRIVSTDPADPERTVATAPIATAAEVTAAVAVAERGYRQWAAVPARERAVVLSRAAAWLRERRATFAALCVREPASRGPRPTATPARRSTPPFNASPAVALSAADARPGPGRALQHAARAPAGSARPSRRGISRSRS